MEIKVCISVQASHEKYPEYVRVTIDDDGLLDWAEKYVEEQYTEGNEAVGVEIESITP